MSNKSRKRIKHEQRVRIAMLERKLKELRGKAAEYETITLHSKLIMRPERDPGRYNAILEMETEQAVRGMVKNLIHSKANQIDETREYSPTYGYVKGYELTLKVFKKR